MVRIRLRRVGAKGQPSYRIVVADSRSPRDGRIIESIGHYNPLTDPPTVAVDEERALHWLSVGAQPFEAVHGILSNLGTLGRFERLRQGESLDALVAEAGDDESQAALEATDGETGEAAETADASQETDVATEETVEEAETAEVAEA
jgi:small subunit ribosomal protein S16